MKNSKLPGGYEKNSNGRQYNGDSYGNNLNIVDY